MARDKKNAQPQEPTPAPGKPLRPDPGYPETRGGTREIKAQPVPSSGSGKSA